MKISELKNLPSYFKEMLKLKKQLKNCRDFDIKKLYPIFYNRGEESGFNEYFWQDFLVARMIYKNNPLRHIDIGSRLDGFATHVASFRKIEIIDIRPVNESVENIIFITRDMMAPIDQSMVGCCDSISSLHVIEHLGLGRYGDNIDANGHLRGLENIYKMLKAGGKFYFSAPVGKQRIEFNAHRIFNLDYLLGLFKDKYKIDSFFFVDKKGKLFKSNFCRSEEGCAIFEMTKII